MERLKDILSKLEEYLNGKKNEAPLDGFLLGSLLRDSSLRGNRFPDKDGFCLSCSVRLGISCQV